jgi:hypothetical protein
MQQFEITLKNEKNRFYDRFALFIYLLNSAGIVVALFYTDRNIINNNSPYLFLTIFIIAIAFPFIQLIQKKVTLYLRSFLIASLAIVLWWVLLGFWWIAICYLLLFLLYVTAKRNLRVSFYPDKILYPSFPIKKIKWNELNNLVLKDRLITIDFKNNKLIQQPIDAESYSVNEQEFNDFCSQQLKK